MVNCKSNSCKVSKYNRSTDLSRPVLFACALWRNPKSSISRNKSTLFSGATDRERENPRTREGRSERQGSGFPENKTNRRPRAARDGRGNNNQIEAGNLSREREMAAERRRKKEEGEIFWRANSVHDSVLLFLTFFLYLHDRLQ